MSDIGVYLDGKEVGRVPWSMIEPRDHTYLGTLPLFVGSTVEFSDGDVIEFRKIGNEG